MSHRSQNTSVVNAESRRQFADFCEEIMRKIVNCLNPWGKFRDLSLYACDKTSNSLIQFVTGGLAFDTHGISGGLALELLVKEPDGEPQWVDGRVVSLAPSAISFPGYARCPDHYLLLIWKGALSILVYRKDIDSCKDVIIRDRYDKLVTELSNEILTEHADELSKEISAEYAEKLKGDTGCRLGILCRAARTWSVLTHKQEQQLRQVCLFLNSHANTRDALRNCSLLRQVEEFLERCEQKEDSDDSDDSGESDTALGYETLVTDGRSGF